MMTLNDLLKREWKPTFETITVKAIINIGFGDIVKTEKFYSEKDLMKWYNNGRYVKSLEIISCVDGFH